MRAPTFLAVYTGSNGPISAELFAASIDEAVSEVLKNSSQWYNDAANVLGLMPDADDDLLTYAMQSFRWLPYAVAEVESWTIHEPNIGRMNVRLLRHDAILHGDTLTVEDCDRYLADKSATSLAKIRMVFIRKDAAIGE